MHRKEPLYKQVFKKLHPTAGERDDYATIWAHHVQNNLLQEVRYEVTQYYGDLTTDEARFPGLNYASPTARRRLKRFPHHRRLFRAFDELGLTESEIFELCNWEGTAYVRSKYEKENKLKVCDTTGDEIPSWSEYQRRKRQNFCTSCEHEMDVSSGRTTSPPKRAEGYLSEDEDDDDDEEEGEDEEGVEAEEELADDEENLTEDEGSISEGEQQQQIDDWVWQALFPGLVESLSSSSNSTDLARARDGLSSLQENVSRFFAHLS